MSYKEHMKLYEESCIEWRKENYIEPSVIKSKKNIKVQKAKRGII